MEFGNVKAIAGRVGLSRPAAQPQIAAPFPPDVF
jgi:hypothetical protein